MIVVTGATGFIGSALVGELNTRGYDQILVCDHIEPKERPEILGKQSFVEFVPANQLLAHLVPQGDKIEAIFHMGACSSTTETDEAYLRKNNTEYTAHLFSFCAKHDIPFIYASSGAVYGDGALGFSDRTAPEKFAPLNLYGWSKINFDIWALQQTKHPSHWHGLRFFNVYGPNEYHKGPMASVAYKAFLQIQETGRLKLFRSHNPEYEDGRQLRDFIYVKDITRWMVDIFESKGGIRSGIFNMGFGKARSWLDLGEAVFKALYKVPNIEWIDIPENIRNQYQYFTEANMDHSFSEGLSQPKWSLENGVKDYVENYLLQTDAYL